MDALGVDADGLDMLARDFQVLASRLSGLAALPRSGPAGQATSAAVIAVHTGIDTTAAALVARMQSTVAQISAASGAYTDQDTGVAGDLDAAGQALEV